MKNFHDIDVLPRHLAIVRSILVRNFGRQAKIFIFGSRATTRAKQFSDLDLAIDIDRKLSLAELADLKQDFEDSDLPYMVDVVDLNNIDLDFKNMILTSGLKWF